MISTVFSGVGASVFASFEGRTMKIWNASTGECVQMLSGHSSPVTSAGVSGAGASGLTASWDTTAKICNASTGECVRTQAR